MRTGEDTVPNSTKGEHLCSINERVENNLYIVLNFLYVPNPAMYTSMMKQCR